MLVDEEEFESLGSFDLIEKLGEGGTGVVWRAVDQRTGREVALKIFKGFGRGDGWFAGGDRRFRFEREAELLSRLEYPGIVRLYEVYLGNDPPYFAMEWVDGQDVLTASNREPLRVIVEWIRNTARAVAFAHRRGILHRDLKPSNILLSKDGEVKVVDFGLGRAFIEETLTQSPATAAAFTREGDAAGTLGYAPPEQILGKWAEVDTRSDVFSLGVVCFQLVAGRLPYDPGESTNEALERLGQAGSAPDPRRFKPELSHDLAAVINKAIRVPIEERYQSMDDFVADLDHWLKGEAVEARAHTERLYRVGKHLRRFAWSYFAGAAALAVILAISLLGYQREVDGREREAGLRTEAEDAAYRALEAKKETESLLVVAESARHQAEIANAEAKAEATAARQQALLARARNLLERGRLQDAWDLLSQAFEDGAKPPWEIGHLLREIEVQAKQLAVRFFTLDHPSPIKMVRFLDDPDAVKLAVFDREDRLTIYEVRQLDGRREVVELRRSSLPEGRWYWQGHSAKGFLFAQVEGKRPNETSHMLLLDEELKEVARFEVPGFVDAGAIDWRSGRLGVLSDGERFELRALSDGGLIDSHPWPNKFSHFSNWRIDFQDGKVFVKGGTWEQASAIYQASDGSEVGKFQGRIQNHYAMSDGSTLGLWSRENGGGSAQIVRFDDLSAGQKTGTLDLPFLHLGLGKIDFSTEPTKGSYQRFSLWQKDNINRIIVDWEGGRSRVETLIPNSIEPWNPRNLRAYGLSEEYDILVLAEEKRTERLLFFDMRKLEIAPVEDNDHHWKAPTEQWAFCDAGDEVLSITSGQPSFGSFPGRDVKARASHLEARDGEGKVTRRWKLAWPESLATPEKGRVAYCCGLSLSPADGKTLAVVLHESESFSVNDSWGDSWIVIYQLDEGNPDAPPVIEPLRSFSASDRPIRAHKWTNFDFAPDGSKLIGDISIGKLLFFDPQTGKSLGELGNGRLFDPSPSGRFWISGDFERKGPVNLVDVQEGTNTPLYQGYFNGAAFTADESKVLVGDGKKEIREFSVTDRSELRSIRCKLIPKVMIPDSQRLIAFKPDRGTLGSVVLADTANGEVIATLDSSAHIAVKARVLGTARTVVLSNSRRAISGFQSSEPYIADD